MYVEWEWGRLQRPRRRWPELLKRGRIQHPGRHVRSVYIGTCTFCYKYKVDDTRLEWGRFDVPAIDDGWSVWAIWDAHKIEFTLLGWEHIQHPRCIG
jgi:hypothetical protein